jgi:hypothetical protein
VSLSTLAGGNDLELFCIDGLSLVLNQIALFEQKEGYFVEMFVFCSIELKFCFCIPQTNFALFGWNVDILTFGLALELRARTQSVFQ